MRRFLAGTRYLIIIPIIGLGLAAAAFFVVGGIDLVRLIIEVLGLAFGLVEAEAGVTSGTLIYEVVEHVHQFLIGTVLYITAIGFYQLFIDEIEFPGWLKIDSTEELETSLVGVTVVVLAVNFLGTIFSGAEADLLTHGAGIALPIAALGVFLGLRAWANRQDRAVSESKREGSSRSDTSEG